MFSLVPRCQGLVRIGKEDLDREPLGQLLVLGHLFPSIIGQGFPQQGGHVPEFFVKPARALVASVLFILARMTKRVVRSTRVPTAEPLRCP